MHWFLILLLVLMGGCASPPPPPDTRTPEEIARDRAALQALFSREASPMASVVVASSDDYFHATVPARLTQEIKSDEEGYQLLLDFGSSSTATCMITRAEIDLASWISLSSIHFFSAMEESMAETQQLLTTDAGAIGAFQKHRMKSPFSAGFVYSRTQ